MKILITGGAGYIGTELSYEIAKKYPGTDIIIYDNLSRKNYNLFIGQNKFQGSNISFIYGDILDFVKLKKIIKDTDIVFHLAAKVSTPFADQSPHEFDQINRWGTYEVVNAVLQSKVKTFIYLSSVSVYGAGEEIKSIKSHLNPRTFYGISKLKAEKYVELLFNNIEKTYIFRSANVYGKSKSMRFDAVINKFMFDANFKNKITIMGSGKQTRAFISIKELINVLSSEEILFKNNLKSGVYNLVSRNLSVLDIAKKIKEIYPESEQIFVNQDIKMRQIKVEYDERIKKIMPVKRDLIQDLLEIKEYFTF